MQLLHNSICRKYSTIIYLIVFTIISNVCVADDFEDAIASILGAANTVDVINGNAVDITKQAMLANSSLSVDMQLAQIEQTYKEQIDAATNTQNHDSINTSLRNINARNSSALVDHTTELTNNNAGMREKHKITQNDELLVRAQGVDKPTIEINDNQCANDGFDGQDFGNAIAQMSMVDKISKNIIKDSNGAILLFKGDRLTCDKDWGSDVKNCCNLKGVFKNIIGHKCPKEVEEILAPAVIRERRCVEVAGWQCVAKTFGKCRKWRKSFCCYQSRLARIFQQIAHHQLGITWGDAEHPNCAPLDPHTFGKLNFDEPYARSLLKVLVDEATANAQQYANVANSKLANNHDLETKIKKLQDRMKVYVFDKTKDAGAAK